MTITSKSSACLQDRAAMDCSSGPRKHGGAIWSMLWLPNKGQKGDTLLTASADGRISTWHFVKVSMLNFRITTSFLALRSGRV